MDEQRKCLQCGNILLPHNKKKIRSDRNFCDSKCRMRYTAIRRYHQIKDSPKYKAYRRKYMVSWWKRKAYKLKETPILDG